MLTAPVVVHAPLTVILQLPLLVKRSVSTTDPSKVKSPLSRLFPTIHVLACALTPLRKAQKPPSSPLPVTAPILSVLPEFCTITSSGMSSVKVSPQLPVSSVKRLSDAMAALATSVPLKAERFNWRGVRVATHPLPCSPAE